MQRRLTTHCGKTVLLVQKIHFGEKHCFNFTVSADYWHLKWKVKLIVYIFSCLITFSVICLHFVGVRFQLFIYIFSLILSCLFTFCCNWVSALSLLFSLKNFSCLFTFCYKCQLFLYIFTYVSCLFTYFTNEMSAVFTIFNCQLFVYIYKNVSCKFFL